MARILAIDYGLKRTGLAVTDPLKIIATALDTIESARIFTFLDAYFKKEAVELILIGEPKNLDDSDTHASADVRRIIQKLGEKFPSIPVQTIDERYTSKMASRALHEMGLKRNKRREKGIIDQVAATMMLQEYLANLDNSHK
jgi:putative holliday junction resolvase